MKGKLELIFNGADAEEALGERKAKSMFENVSRGQGLVEGT